MSPRLETARTSTPTAAHGLHESFRLGGFLKETYPRGRTSSQTGSSGAPCTSCGRRGERALYLRTPASNCTKMSLGRPAVAARSRGAARRRGPGSWVEGAEARTALGVQLGPALPAPRPEGGDEKPARPRRIQQERRPARQGSLSPAQENARSRQGSPLGERARRLPRGSRAPGSSPARPGIGFLHKSAAG